MDPQATVREILGAIADRDRDRAEEHLSALTNWLRRGGFLPKVERTGGPGDYYVPPSEGRE